MTEILWAFALVMIFLGALCAHRCHEHQMELERLAQMRELEIQRSEIIKKAIESFVRASSEALAKRKETKDEAHSG